MATTKRQLSEGGGEKKYVGCRVMELPHEAKVAAAKTAVDISPGNRPRFKGLVSLIDEAVDSVMRPMFLAELTTKYWGAKGVQLSVSFVETTAPELRDRIIGHMNAWGEFCNASFVWSQSQGQVRISRGRGGYWSYLGTDILHIPAGQPTMNLEGFVMATDESEYKRVVRHETGHTLGYPHEHMRREIVDRLDPAKTTAYFLKFQGWDAATTREQVLTPLEESSIMAGSSPAADVLSIMTYALPASITKDGKPIPGGNDIDQIDRDTAAKLYPKQAAPPTPGGRIVIQYIGSVSNATIVPG